MEVKEKCVAWGSLEAKLCSQQKILSVQNAKVNTVVHNSIQSNGGGENKFYNIRPQIQQCVNNPLSKGEREKNSKKTNRKKIHKNNGKSQIVLFPFLFFFFFLALALCV